MMMEMTRRQIDREVARMKFQDAVGHAAEYVDWRIMGAEPDIYEAEYRSPDGDRLYVEGRWRGGEQIADSVDGVTAFFARGGQLEPERARLYYADRVCFFRKRGAQMVRASEWTFRFGWGQPGARKVRSAMLPGR